MTDTDISAALKAAGWTVPQVAQVWRIVLVPEDAAQPQAKPKDKGWNGCVALLLLLGLMAVLLGPCSKQTSTIDTQSTTEQAPEPEALTPISITATDLQKAYSANPVAAKQKYERQIILLTGRIEDIGIVFGKPYVSMKTSESFRDVTCAFPEGASDAIAKLAKDDRITVEGVVAGEPLGSGVLVNDCELVQ